MGWNPFKSEVVRTTKPVSKTTENKGKTMGQFGKGPVVKKKKK